MTSSNQCGSGSNTSNQCWSQPWAPMVEGITNRMTYAKTLELEQLRAVKLYVKEFETNNPISSGLVLYADGRGGTYWASDGVQSTLFEFGNTYLSSIPQTLYLTQLYTNSTISLSNIRANFLELFSTTDSGTTLFTDGTISAHTVVVYGSNTLYNRGILSLYDIQQKIQQGITLSNNQILAGATNQSYLITSNDLTNTIASLGNRYVSSASLQSTVNTIITQLDAGFLLSSVQGIGTARYVSSPSLISTVESLFLVGGSLKSNDIPSTVRGLGTSRYISSLSIQSTVNYLLANPSEVMLYSLTSTVGNLSPFYISSTQLASTITSFFSYAVFPNLLSTTIGLGTANYVSSSGLQSTVRGLNTFFINDTQYRSSLAGFGTASYVSTLSLTSTISGLILNIVANSNTQSTLQQLGSINYVSTLDLASTVTSLSQTLVSNTSVQSTLVSLGSVSYISTPSLTSTVTGVYQFSNILYTSFVASSVTGLGTASYLSSLSLQSTVKSLLTQDVILTSEFYSTLGGLGNIYPSTLISTTDGFVQALVTIPWTRSTVQGLGSASYISSISLQSTTRNLQTQFQTIFALGSTMEGVGTASYVSSVGLQSTVGGFSARQTLLRSELTSTVEGLGTVSYISTVSLQSTVMSILNDLPLNTGVTSSLVGLGALGYVSTLSLTSTVRSIIGSYQTNSQVASTTTGLGTARYLSSLSLLSTSQQLFTNFMTVPGLLSSVTDLGQIYVSSLSLLSTSAVIVTGIVPNDMYSTTIGLGTANYISTPSLVSTFSNIYFNQGGLFTQSLTSTVIGLGTASYVSSQTLQSTTRGIIALANSINIINLTSTVSGLCNVYLRQLRDTMEFISSGSGNFSTVGIATSSSNSQFSLDVRSTAVFTTLPALADTTYGITVINCCYHDGYNRSRIYYSTDGGVNWTQGTVIGGGPPFSNIGQYPGNIRYNGRLFFTIATDNNGITIAGRRMVGYYSFDGINWIYGLGLTSNSNQTQYNSPPIDPTWLTGVSPYGSFVFSRDTAKEIRFPGFGGDGSDGVQCNIGWYFDNSELPTDMKPIINVTWCNSTSNQVYNNCNIFFSGFAWNGIFHCVGGSVNVPNDSRFQVFISYDGRSWIQKDVGFSTNNVQTNLPVAIGQYMYLFSAGNAVCRRSIDGLSWENVNLVGSFLNFNANFGQANQIESWEVPTGYILNGIADSINGSGLSAFFNTSKLINLSNNSNMTYISYSNTGVNGGISPTLYARPIGKDPNRYLLYSINNYTGYTGPYLWYSTDSMATWNSIYSGNFSLLSWVAGIANSFDARSFTVRTGNISILAYNEFSRGYYTGTSNYIRARQITPISTIMNINDGLYIKGSSRGVGVGAQYGMNFRFTSSVSGIWPANQLLTSYWSTPIGITSTIALDVEGPLRLLNDNAYKPTTTSWITYSDQNIKENIQEADLSRCVEIVSSIPLYHYSYISSFYTRHKVQDTSIFGFLANVVSTVFPKSVQEHDFDEMSTFKLLTLDHDQMNMASYGATRYLISTVQQRQDYINSQVHILSSLQNDVSTLCGFYRLS